MWTIAMWWQVSCFQKEHFPVSSPISMVSVEWQFMVATNLKTAVLFPETIWHILDIVDF